MRAHRPRSIIVSMDELGTTLYRVEEDLAGTWLERWVEDGVREIEHYLAKHLAFLTYLDEAA